MRHVAMQVARRLSLVVLVILICAWIYSGWYQVSWSTGGISQGTIYSISLGLSEGSIVLDRWKDPSGMSGWFGSNGWDSQRLSSGPRWAVLPHVDRSPLGMGTIETVSMALWILALVPAVVITMPILFRKKLSIDRCECGYSLRGLGTNAPCPECGRSRMPQ